MPIPSEIQALMTRYPPDKFDYLFRFNVADKSMTVTPIPQTRHPHDPNTPLQPALRRQAPADSPPNESSPTVTAGTKTPPTHGTKPTLPSSDPPPAPSPTPTSSLPTPHPTPPLPRPRLRRRPPSDHAGPA